MAQQPASLASLLLTKIRDIEDKTDEWVIMVHDYKELIIANSTLIVIDTDTIHEFLYRPGDYLYEEHNIDKSYAWIFLFINNLPSKLQFDELISEVYLPQVSYLNELRSKYASMIAYRKKNS